jgi:signal transduction histidine kinase
MRHVTALPAADRTLRRLDVSLLALTGLLALVSLLVWLAIGVQVVADATSLDVAINVAAIVVGAAVAILAWSRWRASLEPVWIYQSSAFVTLTMANALLIGIVVTGREAAYGLSATSPGAAPIYIWTITRVAAAGLLVLAGLRGLRRDGPPARPLAVALLPGAMLLVIAVALFSLEPLLPDAVGIGRLVQAGDVAVPGGVVFLAVQVVIVVAFVAAALLFRRLYRRDRQISDAFLSAGLVVAAFSQVNFALDPVVANGIVTSTDVLRLGFYAILFMGIQAEIESHVDALRRANDELRRLGEVEAASAALAERARLAREIHDGLAQDLWSAKLRLGQVATAPELAEGTRRQAGEVLAAVDAALADARQAVAALRIDPSGGQGLRQVMRRYLDDFGDRYALRVDFTTEGEPPELSPRAEAELLRIVQEALNNVRKHADAAVVRVTAAGGDDGYRITVFDNGRGFDPASVPADRFGLAGMRERASLIGADLRIESQPGDGTRVMVSLEGAGPR